MMLRNRRAPAAQPSESTPRRETLYRYPRRPYWLVTGGALGVAALLAARVLLTWSRLAIWGIERLRPLGIGDFWRPAGAPFAALVSSLLLVGAALLAFRYGRHLLAPLQLTGKALVVREGNRPRQVPWSSVESIVATRLGSADRLILFLRTPAAPPASRLAGLLLGAGPTPGVVVTSALAEFRPVMSYILRSLDAVHGPGEVRFEEQTAGGLLALVAAPHQHLAELWPDALRQTRVRPLPGREALRRAGWLALSVALALPLLLLLDSLLTLQPRVSPLFLLLLGLAEWPLASYWLVATAELLGRSADWRETLALYPHVQGIRWLVVLAAFLMMLLGVPRLWLLPLFLGALLWQGWLIALLVARLTDVPLRRAWAGSAIPLVYQAFLYGLTVFLL